jgi:predicted HAD superfamily Cof-like phosphohydrolase
MRTTLEMVREFHDACDVPTLDSPDISDIERMTLRCKLIKEEFNELEDALSTSDRVEFLDALCDLQYVLDGTFLESGFSSVKQAAMEEVHRSNMSKMDDDGKAIYRDDGKVMKGPNYTPPVLSEFIKEQA